jgi:hypothetical protein
MFDLVVTADWVSPSATKALPITSCDLRWDQVDFNGAVLYVRRVKNGTPSTQCGYPVSGPDTSVPRSNEKPDASAGGGGGRE